MPLIPTRTQAQQDSLLWDKMILDTAEALNNLAATMARCSAEFWSLPDDRLTAVLNADPARTNAVFSANSSLGEVVNFLLGNLAIPQLSARAPLVPGRSLEVGPDGAYSVVPNPAPVDTLP